MDITLVQSGTIFLGCLICGAITGFLYDIFRIARRIISATFIFVLIEDMLFWAATSALLFFAIFWLNDGIIRMYQFIGVAIGLLVYVSLISDLFVGLCMYIYKVLRAIVLFAFKVVTYPVLLLYKLFSRPAKFIAKSTKSGSIKAYRTLKAKTAASLKFIKKQRRM